VHHLADRRERCGDARGHGLVEQPVEGAGPDSPGTVHLCRQRGSLVEETGRDVVGQVPAIHESTIHGSTIHGVKVA
jgi:hypothetical protein